MSFVSHEYHSIFSPQIRWAIRVLSWLAFLIAAYLAWNALNGTSVAGCGIGNRTGCDVVLSSSWARWLGVPVAFGGLACYASLAGISVVLGWGNSRIVRWIDSVTLFLCIVAAGASIWFIALQLFAIGEICRYCMIVDVCGLVIGGLALWSVAKSGSSNREARAAHKGIMALRNVTASRVGAPPILPGATTHRALRTHGRPALGLPIGAAVVLLTTLAGVQIIRPSKTFELQAVALENPIDMTNSVAARNAAHLENATSGQPHTAMRISSESTTDGDSTAVGDAGEGDESGVDNSAQPTASGVSEGDATSDTTQAAPSPNAPKRERLLKLLGGKLTLNVYDHPVLGNPEAPHVVVEMVSYDCTHCRDMHRIVQRGLRRYGDQLAVVILVMPWERSCNKLITDPKASHDGACTIARMALGVATVNPSTFRSFHDWLMADEKKPPTKSEAVAKAYRMVDGSRLREVTGSDAVNEQIGKNVELYAMLQRFQRGNAKSFGLPIQIIGDEMMTGKAEKAEDVYQAWEKNLGLKPR